MIKELLLLSNFSFMRHRTITPKTGERQSLIGENELILKSLARPSPYDRNRPIEEAESP